MLIRVRSFVVRVFRGKWVRWSLVLLLLLMIVITVGEKRILDHSRERLTGDISVLRHNEVGVVFGTAAGSRGGARNKFFVNRINAAAAIYHAGKVDHLLLSGDNGTLSYNEPMAMRKALMAAGVDSTDITLDFAGFSTFDTVVRAKKVFGLDHYTVISQRFQNERALWIARAFGVDAIGFDAAAVTEYGSAYTWLRERGARIKMWIDLFIGKEPHFLGDPVTIGEQKLP